MSPHQPKSGSIGWVCHTLYATGLDKRVEHFKMAKFHGRGQKLDVAKNNSSAGTTNNSLIQSICLPNVNLLTVSRGFCFFSRRMCSL